MSKIFDTLQDLNSYMGAILVVIGALLWMCARLLEGIQNTLSCLHEDFKKVHNPDDIDSLSP